MVNTVSHSIPTKNLCRQIERSDFAPVIALLTRGFPVRAEPYWRRVLSRLETRATPPDYPKYGYLLENEGAVVGVISAAMALATLSPSTPELTMPPA